MQDLVLDRGVDRALGLRRVVRAHRRDNRRLRRMPRLAARIPDGVEAGQQRRKGGRVEWARVRREAVHRREDLRLAVRPRRAAAAVSRCRGVSARFRWAKASTICRLLPAR